MNIDQTIGSIVAEDYRTAEVFSKWKIDFCCKGGRTIDDVCRQKHIDATSLIEDLKTARSNKDIPKDKNIQSWDASELSRYIETTHHKYVREATPVLLAYLKKISGVHGTSHPELHEVFALFTESASELLNHMLKEENVLFSAIRRMESAVNGGIALQEPFFFGSVNNPITMMKDEHEAEGDRFAAIAELTNNYTPPADGCNTYKVAFAKLKEFETDLHRHIHLENNILFHKAVDLEAKINGTCNLSSRSQEANTSPSYRMTITTA